MKILITRTDRIGDVILSLPVAEALRKVFPDAYIAMMVQPRIADLLYKNPYIDEVIVYDKDGLHKGFLKGLEFIVWLMKKRFDMAIVLHTTVRVNLICAFAGIHKRVGYARGKMDFLLTDKLEYTKRLGGKHESEYSLDILRYLGINAQLAVPEIYVKDIDEESMYKMLNNAGIKNGEKFIVLHPGASCISKKWPAEKFAKLADELIKCMKVRVVISLHPDEADIGAKIVPLMENKPVLLCSKTTLGEFAALLKNAILVISNDSGPVHIASACKTPVISIFGRNEKGVSPVRWRPLGQKSAAIQKDAGCVKCLAHNCKKNFLCLQLITVNDVLEEAKKLLIDEGAVI